MEWTSWPAYQKPEEEGLAMQKKRVLALLLMLVLAFSLTTTAFADNGVIMYPTGTSDHPAPLITPKIVWKQPTDYPKANMLMLEIGGAGFYYSTPGFIPYNSYSYDIPADIYNALPKNTPLWVSVNLMHDNGEGYEFVGTGQSDFYVPN